MRKICKIYFSKIKLNKNKQVSARKVKSKTKTLQNKTTTTTKKQTNKQTKNRRRISDVFPTVTLTAGKPSAFAGYASSWFSSLSEGTFIQSVVVCLFV